MRIAFVERLLALGESDAAASPLSRQLRVTNAMAMIGVLLCVTGIPLDALATSLEVLVLDVAAALAFATVFYFNATGHTTMSRVMLGVAANGLMLLSIGELGGLPQLRAVFFPLAVLPFLVFSVRERRLLVLFVVIPVACYFGLAEVPVNRHATTAVDINTVWAPILAFLLLIAGTSAFALVDERAQARLVQLRQRAVQNARLVALGEISSGIAHEVRNPLAAIHLAATQIAENPEDTELVGKLGQRIQRIVMRASRIIESMRTVARDGSADPFVTTPIRRLVDDAIELCSKRLAERAIDVRQDVASEALEVECRSVQVTQVLVNLLNNAFDAVADASERWVKIEVCRADAEWVEIAVANSGPLIAPDVRARLFEPFFTTKPPERGTGIGLSLSRELVEAQGGTLQLDADAPHTRFVIRLPAVQRTT